MVGKRVRSRGSRLLLAQQRAQPALHEVDNAVEGHRCACLKWPYQSWGLRFSSVTMLPEPSRRVRSVPGRIQSREHMSYGRLC